MDWKLKCNHNMNFTSLYIYTCMSSPQRRPICSEVTFLLVSVVFVFSVFYAWEAKNHLHHLLQSCNKETKLLLQKQEGYKELYLQTTFQSGKILCSSRWPDSCSWTHNLNKKVEFPQWDFSQSKETNSWTKNVNEQNMDKTSYWLFHG